MAPHRGDHRLRQIRDFLNHFRMEVRFRMRLDVLQYFSHVVPGGKMGARASQNDQADRLDLARKRIDMGCEGLEHILRQGVEFFRAIEDQRCRSAGV